MKPCRNNLFVILALSASVPSHAAIVTLNTADTLGNSSFNTAGGWSSASAPAAGNDYVVSITRLRTPATGANYAFAGDSLKITTAAGIFSYKTAGSRTITVNNLILNGGLIDHLQASTDIYTLAGNLSVTGNGSIIRATQGPIVVSAPISGTTDLATEGTYTITLSGTSTFTGNLAVSTTGAASADALKLGTNLSNTSHWKFAIGGSGTNNTISGSGKIKLDGVFDIDLTSASGTPGDSWSLVSNSSLNETYGANFTVTGFNVSSGTPGSRVWTRTNSGTFYQFSEATGELTVVDPDTDGDGLTDDWENLHFGNWPTAGQANPLRFSGSDDADGDGATNEAEETAGTDPTDSGSWPDDDSDGLKDVWEIQHFGNTTNQDGSGDADGDFASNSDEFSGGTNPAVASSWPDVSGGANGMNDAWEVQFLGSAGGNPNNDSDSDGFTDKQEHDYHTDPSDNTVSPALIALRHRWSFTNDLVDSVGGSNATISDLAFNGNTGVTQNPTSVSIAGGTKTTFDDFVTLGSNLLPNSTDAVTIELWATQDAVQNWARIFDFNNGTGEYATMTWTRATDINTDRVVLNDARPDGTSGSDMVQDANAPYTVGTEYHIVMTLQPLAGTNGKTKVTVYSASASAADLGAPQASFESSINLINLTDQYNDLGYSPWTGDFTASATYNEVRMWKGSPTQFVLEALHDQGADNAALPADSDGDSLPDAWETATFGNLSKTGTADTDGDGFSNHAEYIAGSNANNSTLTPQDTDGDGLQDAWEIQYFGNITAQIGSGDPDGDGLTNEQEETNGSSPINDEDGLTDAWEVFYFGSAATQTGTQDSDGDGYTNAQELNLSQPNNIASTPVDVNGDGILDSLQHKLAASDALGTASFDSGLNWNDTTAPAAGGTYIVAIPNLRTPGTAADITFAGARLDLIDIYTGRPTLLIKYAGTTTITTTLPLITLNGGEIQHAADSGVVHKLAGTIQVKGPVKSYLAAKNGGIVVDAVLSGSGPLDLINGNAVTLNAVNTFTGNLNVINDNGLTLGATGSLKFVPTTSGVTNVISGSRPVTLNGTFNIDLGAASSAPGSSWDLITSTGTLTIGSTFAVSGFSPDAAAVGSRIWTSGSYQYNEATGILNVASGGDTDGDGMDDAWETTYFGGLGQGAAGDFDGDGTDNLTEYRLGLTPNSGASRFSLTAIDNNPADGYTVSWQGATGVTFVVQRSTDGMVTWSNVSTQSGSAGTMSYTDPSPVAGKAFYRVALQP